MLTGEAEVFSVLILILVFALLFLRLLDQGKMSFRAMGPVEGSFVTAMVSFIFLGVLMAWTSGKGDAAYWGFRYYTPALLVFVVVYHSISKLRQENKLPRIIRLVRNILFINAFLAVADYLTAGGLGLINEDDRYSGLISNANDAGFLFNVLIILNYYLFRQRHSRLGLIGILFAGFAVFVTFSKTAIISAIVILIMILRKEITSGRLSTRFLLAIVMIGVVYKGSDLLTQVDSLEATQGKRLIQIMEFFKGNVSNEITTNRTEILEVALDKLRHQWVFGQGIQSFSNIESLGVGSHNIYILILGESGIIPLILYMVFLLRMAMVTKKKQWRLPGSETVRLLAFALFMYGFTNHNIFFSKFIILIIALGVVLVAEIKQSGAAANGSTIKQ